MLPANLVDHVQLDIGVVGALLVALRLFDIATDTAVGVLSDIAIFPRWGRRRLWMTAGAAPALLGSFAVFTAPPGATLIFLSAWLAVMTVGWSMINAAHGAWALEAGEGVAARGRVFAGRTAAGILGYLAFSGLAALTPAAGEQLGAMTLALVVGVPVSTALAVAIVPDRSQPQPERFRLGDLAAGMALGFATPSKARLAIMFALVGAGQAVSAGSFVFLLRHGLGLPQQVGNGLLLQAVATLAGLPLGLAMVRRVGAERTLGVIFAATAVISLLLLVLPGQNTFCAMVWLVLRGLLSGVDFLLLRTLAGEELDQENKRRPRGRAGAYYAAFHLPFNLAGAAATGLLFWLYDSPGHDSVAGATSREFVLIPALGGALFALVALMVLNFFRPAVLADPVRLDPV